MDIECGNEECKYKTKIKTKDFLNTKYTYKYHCKKCGHDTIFDTKKSLTDGSILFPFQGMIVYINEERTLYLGKYV